MPTLGSWISVAATKAQITQNTRKPDVARALIALNPLIASRRLN